MLNATESCSDRLSDEHVPYTAFFGTVNLAEHQCRTGAATEASRFARLAKTGLRYSLQALKAFKLCLGCVLEAGHDVSVQLRQEDTDAWTDISAMMFL